MRSRMMGAWLIGLSYAAALGCGGDGTDGPGGGPTGMFPTGTQPTVNVGVACNSLDIASAPSVSDERGGPRPTLNGGAIADGTYYLTRYQWHKPDNERFVRRTVLVVSGGQYQWMGQRLNESASRNSGTLSASGTGISMQLTCPQAGDHGWDSYGVSGNTLVIHDKDDDKTATFVRQ